jgi:hypothetical protein
MGFMGSTGQLEFLLHAVENAPALEVLTLDPACRFNVDNQGRTYFTEMVREMSRKHLSEKVQSFVFSKAKWFNPMIFLSDSCTSEYYVTCIVSPIM